MRARKMTTRAMKRWMALEQVWASGSSAWLHSEFMPGLHSHSIQRLDVARSEYGIAQQRRVVRSQALRSLPLMAGTDCVFRRRCLTDWVGSQGNGLLLAWLVRGGG
jgi:hypothetical protein